VLQTVDQTVFIRGHNPPQAIISDYTSNRLNLEPFVSFFSLPAGGNGPVYTAVRRKNRKRFISGGFARIRDRNSA
jgi:hypothetical protein